jgi:hypothetical protein
LVEWAVTVVTTEGKSQALGPVFGFNEEWARFAALVKFGVEGENLRFERVVCDRLEVA